MFQNRLIFYHKRINGTLKIYYAGLDLRKDMKFALLRSVQLFAMIITLSGLYIGIRDNNVMLELNALKKRRKSVKLQ